MASLNTEARAAWRNAAYKNPDEIEHDIDDTRADLAATLEALEHKLSPNHLMDMTLGRVRQHGGEFAGNLGSAVRDNPVPLLLTSIGIAWMMMSNRQHNGDGGMTREPGVGSRLRGRMRDAADRWTDAKDGASERWAGAKEGAGERLAGVKDTLSGARERLDSSRESLAQTAGSMRDGARRATDATRAQMDRMRGAADHLIQDQPLVLGAIGIVAGAVIGAALPATEEEDRLIGSARDSALDKAKRAGAEGYRKVRGHAENIAETAKAKLRENGAGEGNGGTPRFSDADDSDWRDASTTSQDANRRTDGGDRWDPAAATSTMASAGAAGAVPSSAWVSGSDNTGNQSSEREDGEGDGDSLGSIGENPTEPRSTKRRPSERGVGREHASDSFTTPDSSPTSKTPPL